MTTKFIGTFAGIQRLETLLKLYTMADSNA